MSVHTYTLRMCKYVNTLPLSQVRLLIGIARFKEMSYIIGLLMKHDEFESLIMYKGTEKVTIYGNIKVNLSIRY